MHEPMIWRMTTKIIHYFAVVQCWPLLAAIILKPKTGHSFSKITPTEEVFQTHEIHLGPCVQTTLLVRLWSRIFTSTYIQYTPRMGTGGWTERTGGAGRGDKTRGGENQRGLWSGALLKSRCTGLAVFKLDRWGGAWMDGWIQGGRRRGPQGWRVSELRWMQWYREYEGMSTE